MKEVLQKSFLLVALVAFMSHIGALMPAISYGKVMQDSQVIVSTKLKDVSQSDIERVIKEAEIALDSIPALLGIDGYKKDIKIKKFD